MFVKNGKDPTKIFRRKDGSVKRQWWTPVHYCGFKDGLTFDYQTEDELQLDNHMINHGIEGGDDVKQRSVYVSQCVVRGLEDE